MGLLSSPHGTLVFPSRNPCLSPHRTLVFPLREPLSFPSRNPCLSPHETLVFPLMEPLSFPSRNPCLSPHGTLVFPLMEPLSFPSWNLCLPIAEPKDSAECTLGNAAFSLFYSIVKEYFDAAHVSKTGRSFVSGVLEQQKLRVTLF